MSDRRKLVLGVLAVVLLVVAITGITVAFFNYTRTGNANTFGTGRIYFDADQNGRINMTNLFPLTSTQASSANLDSVSIEIEGDTTYTDGEEFLISIVDVNNTAGGKTLPLKYTATYTANQGGTIGTASNNYWTARDSKNANIYLLNAQGGVREDAQILVGYIDNGATGIDGTITVKAYVDADRIAISDTYDGMESANMGTTTDWVNGRTVFTTTEWNSLQGNNAISFRIKAESNEGIWVEEPAQGTIDSCPNCKFYAAANVNGDYYTTWNSMGWDDINSVSIPETPTVITSGLYDDYRELMATTGKNFFLGVRLNNNNEITNAYACGVKGDVPFCIEGTSEDVESSVMASNYANKQSLLQGVDLYNNTCISGEDQYDGAYISCGVWDGISIYAEAQSIGGVIVGTDNANNFCHVYSYGLIECRSR